MSRDEDGPRPRNFLRDWREYRQLTQAQLAALVGTEGSVISLLESGDRGLSHKWLDRLAPALETTAGLLLEYRPDQVGEAISDIRRRFPEANESLRARSHPKDLSSLSRRHAAPAQSEEKVVELSTPKREEDRGRKAGSSEN